MRVFHTVYGVFNSSGEHLITYEYGDTRNKANEHAKRLGYNFYARELTLDEYHDRLKLLKMLNFI